MAAFGRRIQKQHSSFLFQNGFLFQWLRGSFRKDTTSQQPKKKKPFRNSKWTSCIKWRPKRSDWPPDTKQHSSFLFQNGFLFQWLRGRFIFPKVILPIFKRINYFTTQKSFIKPLNQIHQFNLRISLQKYFSKTIIERLTIFHCVLFWPLLKFRKNVSFHLS